MKKLLLLVMFLITTGLVLGQENYSKISQDGVGHTVDISQTGQGNVIGDPNNPDEGGIVQSGEANNFLIFQSGSDHIISQYRAVKNVYNAAVQNGTGNTAMIQQIGEAHVVGLRTYAYHPGLEQVGNYNTAEIYQDGSSNQVGELYQYGSNNVAGVDQSGTANYANLHQRGNGQYNMSSIVQLGNSNDAGDIAVNGSNNMTVVVQGSGVGGGVIITSQNEHLPSNGDGQFPEESDNNQATQWINGESNGAFVLQGGMGSNNAFQHLPSTYYGANNYVIITQYGTQNDATQYVGGNGNDALIDQFGSMNSASINTIGDNNSAEVFQEGTGLSSH